MQYVLYHTSRILTVSQQSKLFVSRFQTRLAIAKQLVASTTMNLCNGAIFLFRRSRLFLMIVICGILAEAKKAGLRRHHHNNRSQLLFCKFNDRLAVFNRSTYLIIYTHRFCDWSDRSRWVYRGGILCERVLPTRTCFHAVGTGRDSPGPPR